MEMPRYEFVIDDMTGVINLKHFAADHQKMEVTTHTEDVTEKCLRAVFGHLAINCDMSGSGRVYMNLVDPIGRTWQLGLARVMDDGRVASE